MITVKKTKKVMVKKITIANLKVNPLVLQVHKTYSRIWEIGRAFNTRIPTRKGFGYLEPNVSQQRTALWCLHLASNPYWINTLTPGETVIIEKKNAQETPVDFHKRVTGSRHYRADVERITFVKEPSKDGYRFVGVFKLAQFDFERQEAVFHRVYPKKLVITLKQQVKVDIQIVNEESITVLS